MMFIIKRIEDGERVRFLDKNGWFTPKKEEARLFDGQQDAMDYIEDEKDDPKYDKPYIGKMEFIIEEVDG